jgi:uncharacterized UBP type Zn finger protein
MTLDAYRGVYMLQEKVSRDKHRVNVTKFDANSGDLSGVLMVCLAGGLAGAGRGGAGAGGGSGGRACSTRAHMLRA